MKRIILLADATFALMGVSGAAAQQARQLSIATGGIYYPLAGGFGTIIATRAACCARARCLRPLCSLPREFYSCFPS